MLCWIGQPQKLQKLLSHPPWESKAKLVLPNGLMIVCQGLRQVIAFVTWEEVLSVGVFEHDRDTFGDHPGVNEVRVRSRHIVEG